MRRVLFPFAVLLVLLLLGSDSPKEHDDQIVVDPLEGTWRLIDFEIDGKKKDDPDSHLRTFRSGTYTFSDGCGEPGHYHIDTTCKPPHLDEFPSSGPFKYHPMIYQIDGNTLRIAFTTLLQKMRRPQGFNDESVRIYTYKRVN